ncbi:MAG: crotonyl-CoA carboxylase/reductase [Parafilimonas sp.]|nr:crotonyl-CoA carboxylase/reductase [Parafilimonas sp.]
MQTIEIGTLPPLGEIPEYMYAQTLRRNRYNVPLKAFEIEKVKVPELREDEVLVAVMAAGLNYNSVWAATGFPMDMIQVMQLRKEAETDFQIAGSDCSGIVYKVGDNVKNVAVGDEVVIQAGWCESNDPFIKNGGMRIVAPSARAWGYETSWGSFAQFCKAKDFMCVPKPKHLNWDEAAVYMLSGATIYRMLTKYEPHVVKPGDVVLIWGGAGGLGTMAIQFTKLYGGIPVAVVNSEEKKKFCESMGALAINRCDYDHWGALSPDMLKPETQEIWRGKAKKFLKKIMELTGGKLPRIVLEHPGEATMPTSMFVCDRDGMVVTCAGTSGYMASFDIRYLWLQLKRLQGSHFADTHECVEFNQLVIDGKINPVLGQTVSFEELPAALQEMYNNTHKGNTAIKVGYK